MVTFTHRDSKYLQVIQWYKYLYIVTAKFTYNANIAYNIGTSNHS